MFSVLSLNAASAIYFYDFCTNHKVTSICWAFVSLVFTVLILYRGKDCFTKIINDIPPKYEKAEVLRIQKLFCYYSITSAVVVGSLAACTLQTMHFVQSIICILDLFLLSKCYKYFGIKIDRNVEFPESALDFTGILLVICSVASSTIIDMYAIAAFLIVFGLVVYIINKSVYKPTKSLILLIIFAIAISLVISQDINYNFAHAEDITTVITEKDESVYRGHTSYSITVDNKEAGINNEIINVTEETFNAYDVNDSFKVSKRTSIFSVILINDPSYNEPRIPIVHDFRSSKEAEICIILFAIIVGVIASWLTVHGHKLLLFILVYEFMACGLAISLYVAGDNPLAVKISIFFVLLPVLPLFIWQMLSK